MKTRQAALGWARMGQAEPGRQGKESAQGGTA